MVCVFAKQFTCAIDQAELIDSSHHVLPHIMNDRKMDVLTLALIVDRMNR